MDTRVFGPSGWALLHGLPWRAEPRAAEAFVWATANVLPCIYCRQSFRLLLRQQPLSSRAPIALAEWLWRAHNAVNAKLGKPQYPFEAVIANPISDADWRQAAANLASFVALNYPELPSDAQRSEYEQWFSQLAALLEFSSSGLDASLDGRNQLYAWLRSAMDLPDDQSVVELARVRH